MGRACLDEELAASIGGVAVGADQEGDVIVLTGLDNLKHHL